MVFPTQVAALCLVLYTAVNYYQSHYSFEATMRAHPSEQARRSHSPKPLALDTELPLAAAKDATANATTSLARPVPIERESASKNIPVAATIQPTKQPLVPDFVPLQVYKKQFELLTDEWILKQKSESFVIQLAASGNNNELKNYARALRLPGPLAMYPFRKSNEGKLLYGLSFGLYNSHSAAVNALSQLPEETGRYGSWIRNVSAIKAQINNLKSE